MRGSVSGSLSLVRTLVAPPVSVVAVPPSATVSVSATATGDSLTGPTQKLSNVNGSAGVVILLRLLANTPAKLTGPVVVSDSICPVKNAAGTVMGANVPVSPLEEVYFAVT